MIVILAPYFAPAYKAGGPIKSLRGFSKLLLENNRELKVVTRNNDIDGSILGESGKYDFVDYRSKASIGKYRKDFKNAELIWFNSLYSVPFTMIPVLALFFSKKKTVLISPRGSMLPGTTSFKKKVYLRILKTIFKILPHRFVMHYSNEYEKQNSIPMFAGFDEVFFNNPLTGELQDLPITGNSKKVLACFGRMSAKKNLGFIIDVLGQLPEDFTLELHGALEHMKYVDQLKEQIASLGLEDRVSFEGEYSSDNFGEKVNEITVGLIPSLSENFCHVFFEFIEGGRIVVASDGLPWGFANKEVPETILPLEEELWKQRILEISKMSDDDYHTQQKKLCGIYNKVKDEIEEDFLNVVNTITD